ncbi:hypothetical protein D5071_07490 [Pectobacterium carotovorum]|uniref:Uncharacterized protein n=1 Tax=Pectobacterium carotovorum TaxID=554 RepID=A0A419AXZ8_PECCA|nr:hypothetical protein D5071_07490 [Pectobacterium carotovorum]
MNITLLSAFLKLNLYEIVSNTNNRGLLFTVNDVQYKIATCFLDEDELKCYLKNLYSMNITIMNLLDINFDYYPRLSNYAFSSEKYLLSSSFKKMKSTRERFDSFRTGKKVFTENEFDDFNATFDSYITQ